MANETSVQPQIESIGLFKNGVAVVKAAFTVPGPGCYRWEAIPQAIHGTFAVESEATLITRTTHRIIEEDLEAPQPDMQHALAGKKVTVSLTGENGKPATVQGRVCEPPAVPANTTFSTQYPTNDSFGRYYWGPNLPYGGVNSCAASTSDFLILESPNGREYINRQRILTVSAEGPFGMTKHKVEKPVMLFDVSSGGGVIHITYLARGMAWLPAYTVDTSDASTLTIRQSAVVRNELMKIHGTELSLISGYPNIKFSHVDSPLNPDTPLATFFQQLNSQGNGSPGSMTQMVTFNSMAPPASSPLPDDTESGPSGADIHYQPVGKHDLDRGDSLSLSVASAKSSYIRIVDWTVPDSRDPSGRRPNRSNNDVPDPDDQPWDAICFTNPFKFPMTTAPASIMESGKFRGQSLSQWVNPGQKATLRVTQALSIRAQASEVEEENTRSNPKPENITWFGSSRHQRITIKGALQIHNFRNAAVPMRIRCRFSGELLDADAKPGVTLLNETAGINPHSEINWESVQLKPGEERVLHYRYQLWIRY